jgi:hypothetical protein
MHPSKRQKQKVVDDNLVFGFLNISGNMTLACPLMNNGRFERFSIIDPFEWHFAIPLSSSGVTYESPPPNSWQVQMFLMIFCDFGVHHYL